MVFLLFLAWLVAAWFIYMATLGTIEPAGPWSFGRFMGAVFTTPQGLEMAVIGNLVGLCFAAVVLALSVVSFPMLIDREVTLEMAMRTSIRVTITNPGPIAAWGVIVVFLLVLGSIPAFVGLAVVLPVLGYATWHLYRCTVARSDVPPVEGEPAA
jgi:uncharacterized membrane protein